MNEHRAIATEHLTLRAFDAADVDPLFEIQRSRDAMRYTLSVSTRAESEANLSAHTAVFEERGLAPWTVVLRETGSPIGWGGLTVDLFDPRWGVELVYFVHRDRAQPLCDRRAASIVGGSSNAGAPGVAPLGRAARRFLGG